jgi:hypothetical protein
MYLGPPTFHALMQYYINAVNQTSTYTYYIHMVQCHASIIIYVHNDLGKTMPILGNHNKFSHAICTLHELQI